MAPVEITPVQFREELIEDARKQIAEAATLDGIDADVVKQVTDYVDALARECSPLVVEKHPGTVLALGNALQISGSILGALGAFRDLRIRTEHATNCRA